MVKNLRINKKKTMSILAATIISITSGVEATIDGSNNNLSINQRITTLYEGTTLDNNLFENLFIEKNLNHLIKEGWSIEADNGGHKIYCHDLPNDKGTMKYNPITGKMKWEFYNIKGILVSIEHPVKFILYGEIENITGSMTTINITHNEKEDLPENSDINKLVIIYRDHVDGDEYKNPFVNDFISHITEFGNILTRSFNNPNRQMNNLVGFSRGGMCAMHVMEDEERAKVYDKVTLINISPGYNDGNKCYAEGTLYGKTVEIIQTYNNIIVKRNGTADFYTTQISDKPHLDKLLESGANIIITIPNLASDEKKYVTELVNYAKGLIKNNPSYADRIIINEFDLSSETDIFNYNNGAGGTSHEYGRYIINGRSLVNYYASDDTNSIDIIITSSKDNKLSSNNRKK